MSEEDETGIGPILLSACKRGNINLLKQLIEENGEKLPVNCIDGLGNGPLHYAAMGNHIEIAELLFEKYSKTINPNLQNFAGDTPVHKCVEKDNIEFLELLVSHKADTNIVNKKGRNPTSFAKSQKAKEIIKMGQIGNQIQPNKNKDSSSITSNLKENTDTVSLTSVKAELDPDMIADENDTDD